MYRCGLILPTVQNISEQHTLILHQKLSVNLGCSSGKLITYRPRKRLFPWCLSQFRKCSVVESGKMADKSCCGLWGRPGPSVFLVASSDRWIFRWWRQNVDHIFFLLEKLRRGRRWMRCLSFCKLGSQIKETMHEMDIFFSSTFCLSTDGFQGLSQVFQYPVQLLTFYLLLWFFASLWLVDVLDYRPLIGCRENAKKN
jgi:hypothetical protein